MDVKLVLQILTALGGTGLSIFFLKRLISDFDEFRKEYRIDMKSLNVKLNDLHEKALSLNFRIENLQSSIESIKEMIKAGREESKDLEKKLGLYKDVLSRLISEWKNIQEEIKTVKVELGKHSVLVTEADDKKAKKYR